MAKGNAFIGIVSGKIGDTVGYRVANSNDKVVQGWRPYQSKVTNPKTEPQAIQRLKMAPALNFYRQLAQVLDNAWQGQRYGTKSRQYFMSLAMKQSTGIPFILKGDKKFYPGEYPVAQGSLIRMSVSGISTDLLNTSIVSPGISGTWGEVSQGIINKNFGIKDGDKLTFIFVGQNSQGDYVPAYSYVILDTTSTSTAADVLTGSNLSFAGTADAALTVGVVNAVSGIVAGAVILSRLDTTGSPSWQRSNSIMFCSESYKNTMMSLTAYQAAIISYMSSENLSSDWYLNAGINGGINYVGPGGNSGSNLSVVSIANISVTFVTNPTPAAVATMSDGTKRAYRSNATPSKIMHLVDSDLAAYSQELLVASDENLAKIQAVDTAVTGWIVASPTSGGTVIEEP